MTDLEQLIATAIKLNRPDFHTFVSFSGHVDVVHVSWYCGGWSEHKPKSGNHDIYISGSLATPNKKVNHALHCLLNNSDNNEMLTQQEANAVEERERMEYERLKAKYK